MTTITCKMRNLLGLLLIFVLSLAACKQSTILEKKAINIDLEDAVIQQIFNFQNKRNTNALLPYLTVENPTHRYLAALAFGSVQDSAAITELLSLLNDPYEEVRYAATYALGQTKNVKAAAPLAAAFVEDTSRLVQAGILEAIGRCGTEEHLKYLAVNRPYPIQDSLLLEGQALAIFRFALRGMVHKEGTTKIMNDYIANALISTKARFVAASYLARTKGIDLSDYENVLINSVREVKDKKTLMALVIALAKTKTTKAFQTLSNNYKNQSDYRIRCNIIRGLQHFNYDSVKTLAFKALEDRNPHVQLTAAEYLTRNGSDLDAGRYYDLGLKSNNWEVSAKLLGAAVRNTSYFKSKTKSFFSQKLIAKYKETEDPYKKAAYLEALGNHSWNYRFIISQIFPVADSIKIPEVIRSSGTLALLNMRLSETFSKELGLSKIRVSNEMNEAFKRCIIEGDPAMQAIAGSIITEEELNLNQVFTDYQFIKDAQSRLSLPGNIETYLILQKAINYLEGNPEKTIDVPNRNPTDIDWPLIRVLKDQKKVTIRTSKGNIVLRMHPEVAPATVTQFVHLAKAKYYDNKFFHRVVPNFVAQGGCSRGDGYSGFDITVVSEFSPKLRYESEGWVGMASAGKDTESAQFFITHSPTLHLDGNYTIFAKVVEGMDVVHQLRVGDRISAIDI